MPSMKRLQSCTSDIPRRSELEISQVPPVDAESTPAVPRACRRIFFKVSLKSERAEKRGSLTIAPARRPVPRLDGQENESEMVVVHDTVSIALKRLTNGLRSICEAREDSLDVITIFHGDNAHLILL